MTRQISNRDYGAEGSERLIQFVRIERASGLPAQARDLQKRPESRLGHTHVKAFVEIERRAARLIGLP